MGNIHNDRYDEIKSLLKLPDGCYKSNNDFGKLIGIGGGGISKQIKKLVDIQYKSGNIYKLLKTNNLTNIKLDTIESFLQI